MANAETEGLADEALSHLAHDLRGGVMWSARTPTLELSFVSDSALELLGLPVDQWRSERGFLKKHVHPDDWGHLLEAIFDATSDGRVHTLQHRMFAAGGLTLWAQTSVSRSSIADGGLSIAALTVDITQVKRAELAWRDAETHSRLLIDNIRDYAVFMISPDGSVASWNVGARRLEGYSAPDIVGLPFSRFFPKEELAKETPRRMLADAELHGRAEYEGFMISKSGIAFWGSMSLSAVLDERGQLQGFSTIARELTERKKTEQALAESEEQLRLMVESVQDYGVFMVSRDGAVQSWNRGSQRLVHYRTHEVIGAPLSTFFPGEENGKQTPERLLETALVNGSSGYEGWLVRRQGSRFWASLTVSLVEDRAGHGRGFSIVLRDVSERKRSEDALRESELRLRLLIDSLTDHSVVMLTPEGRVSSWSPGAERLKGFRAEEILGQPFARFFTPEEVARGTPQALIARAAAEGQAEFEGWMIRKGGSTLWAAVTLSAVRNGGGQLRGYSLVGRDMTGRMQAERAQTLLSEVGVMLSTSLDYRETLERVVHLATRSLAHWCAVEITTDASVEAVTVAHVDPGKESVLQQMMSSRGSQARLRKAIAGVLQTGEPELRADASAPGAITESLGLEDPQLVADLATQSCLCVPLAARGKILGAMLFVSAPRKRYGREDLMLAQELGRRVGLGIDHARLYQQAQSAVHVRDQILAVVSHDLLNPVNTIQLLASQLSALGHDGENAARTTRAAERIRRATDRMTLMIRDLLDYSNIETGQLRIELASQDVGSMVAEALELLQPIAAAKGIKIHDELQATSVSVRCDRDRILQVFSNLIGNAVKFAGKDAIVTVRTHAERDRVVFSVSDNGPGISEADLPHIFDRYWQGQSSFRGSLGLGLAIAKTVIEAQGGAIWARSALGEGTTIFFTLPIG